MKLEELHVYSITMDLDGTLWDLSQICARAWNSTLEQLSLHIIRFLT